MTRGEIPGLGQIIHKADSMPVDNKDNFLCYSKSEFSGKPLDSLDTITEAECD
jgi:hypothetical protein